MGSTWLAATERDTKRRRLAAALCCRAIVSIVRLGIIVRVSYSDFVYHSSNLRLMDFVCHSTLGFGVIVRVGSHLAGRDRAGHQEEQVGGRAVLSREAGPPNHHDDKVDSDQ